MQIEGYYYSNNYLIQFVTDLYVAKKKLEKLKSQKI